MQTRRALPVALTIAGSDSGGGAGIQADLKTFAALNVHGTAAVTCVTAQNPDQVLGIEPCSPPMVRKQLVAIFNGFKPRAIKTGMLYTPQIIRSVSRFLRESGQMAVIDPVMVSTSGKKLITPAAQRLLIRDLIPRALLLTPNVPEAESLLGRPIRTVSELRAAAREMSARFCCAVLAKGGHLRGLNVAADIYFDGKNELLLSAPWIHGIRTHGTGCTYSAAVTAYLAHGSSLIEAVGRAKQYVSQAIARSHKAGRQYVLAW